MKEPPVLVLVSGPAGSGKSTLAREVARRYRLAYLDYDSLGQSFLESIHRRYHPDERYEAFCAEWREEAYLALWRAAADSLSAGASLAASAPCSKEWREPRFFSELKARYSVDFLAVSIELLPDADALRERLVARGEARDAGKLRDWAQYVKSLPPPAVWDADHRFALTRYGEGCGAHPFAALLDRLLRGPCEKAL